MGRRLATLTITLGLALGAPALGVLASAPAACAATDQRAALVVDTGEEARSYCVALGADSVSGTDLIRLAHDQYGLDYRLGFGGRAICRLAGVGVDGGDCFGAYPDFWGYWHGNGSGGWTWAGGSAADWTVDAGDVEGWQWGPGQDGDTHAAPPATREEDVCEPLDEPSPEPSSAGSDHDGDRGGGEGDRGGAANDTTGPAASASASQEPAARDDRAPRDRVPADDLTPSPTPSSTGAPPVVLAAGEDPGGGASAGAGGSGALIAIVAVAILGGTGAFVLRRRRAG